MVPNFNIDGDLPVGVYPMTIGETAQHFGSVNPTRRILFLRLKRVYDCALQTGHLHRFIVFGSFVTNKPMPNDVDIFMIMDNDFDVAMVTGADKLIFDHLSAQTHFGASIFWIRKLAAVGGEQTTIENWQIKRNGAERGIVEIVK